MEKWKHIPGYEGFYQVSNLGRVRSLDRISSGKALRGKQIKIGMDPRGYCHFHASKNGTTRTIKVHQAVCWCFLRRDKKRTNVNHKNGIKTDNRVSNLEWCTPKENMSHAFRTGLNSHHGGLPKLPVMCVDTGTVFESQLAAAKVIGATQGNLRQSMIKGYTVKGFRFVGCT